MADIFVPRQVHRVNKASSATHPLVIAEQFPTDCQRKHASCRSLLNPQPVLGEGLQGTPISLSMQMTGFTTTTMTHATGAATRTARRFA